MPLTVYLCLLFASFLLLLLCSSKFCLGSHYTDCLSGNTCGDFKFSYPFGKNDSGCGDPEFQLRCDYGVGYPLLNISGQLYRILDFSASNNHITIVNDNLLGRNCSFPGNYSHFWKSSFRFHMAVGYTNLTLWRHCNESINGEKFQKWPLCGDDWYHFTTPESGTRFCQINLQVPIQDLLIKQNGSLQINQTFLERGFQIKRYVDTNRDQSCGTCLHSKGMCGYNVSEPTSFLCYCPDGTSHPEICTGNMTVTGGRNMVAATGGRNMSAIIIGCSIGGFALTAIALLFLAYYAKRRRPTPPNSISKVEKFLKEYAYEMPIRYSHSQLKKITNNFAEKLGEGGFGTVYKGKLRNGSLVAVKILDRHRHSETQFMNEVATVGRVYQVNLVRMLGYCFESLTSAVVYEYMVNGSLEKFIFARKEKGEVLSWDQLYTIALGAARGIAYLHEDCDKRIIHFDIKPHNILLDADFTPKVSDFGLAKLCGKGDDHISMTAGRGTPGYVAPEVCDRELGPVTDKSDVYSFGMFLLEIVGGRKNFDWKVSRSSQFYFPEWAFKLLEGGELGIRLRRGGSRGGEMEAEDEAKATRLTKVGLWCIQYEWRDRPAMSRVVQMLEGTGDDVANPPLPSNSLAEPEKPLGRGLPREQSSLHPTEEEQSQR